MALVTLENLSFTYPNAKRKALDQISLTVGRGAFVTLMGATGSGKSTLLRLLKPELRQNGVTEGEIRYSFGRSAPLIQSLTRFAGAPAAEGSLGSGIDTDILQARMSAEKIGYVAQSPEEQIVTDKVWHELAFTLESLGADRNLIARRIAETASYFDIDGWMERDTATLSGGEKQLLNLAAVMTADPELLLLDEPTAQLDPIAAARFIETVYRLNRETGVTVLLCEHRAEELFPICDQVVILDRGTVAYSGAPQEVAAEIGKDARFSAFLPTAARIYQTVTRSARANDTLPQSTYADSSLYRREPVIPLGIREGQRWIYTFENNIRSLDDETEDNTNNETALSLKNVYFRYERGGADILRDLSMEIKTGEVFALLGSNGAGKSTLAAVVAGLRRPYSGSVKLFGKRLKDYPNGSLYRGNISLLPQDVESVFLCETVGEELKGCEAAREKLPYDLTPLFDRHPYDLSGGERQLAALCRALAADPRFLILDEPSKGLDNGAKMLLCDVIRRLKADGVTLLLITHDVEFAALCADRCALFAQGQIAAVDRTERFMSENRFYTTAASRITRRRYDGAYTAQRAAELIRRNGGALCS